MKDFAYAFQGDISPIVIVDLPRKRQNKIDEGLLEKVKDGRLFVGKYESCRLKFLCPHVIVFSNAPPNRDNLSEDRWSIVNLDNEEDVEDRRNVASSSR